MAGPDHAAARTLTDEAIPATPAMRAKADTSAIPDERLSIEKRGDGALVVRVRSEGPETSRLPDAVFSFRCGDPQYAYWLGRLSARADVAGR